jgi:hypothetical protein
MPITSKRQLRFMYANAAKSGGKVSSKVAKKMISDTSKKKRSSLMKGKLKPKKKK